MLTFRVLDTLKPSDDVLKMIANNKYTNIKVNNGKTILIERTNIKSVKPIIYELTYNKRIIISIYLLLKEPIHLMKSENY